MQTGTTSGGAVDPRTFALLSLMYVLLLGNVLLYLNAPLPLALHMLISVVAIHLAFTVWHEGVHHNASRSDWLNDAVGILGIFPYTTPYFLQKWVHLQHHAHLNRPEDPNSIYIGGPFWSLPFRYPKIVLYLRDRVGKDPRTPRQRIADAIPLLVVLSLYVLAGFHGRLLDLVLLWFVPVVIAKVVMDWYINYLPHVGLPPDRYLGTRILDVSWFTPLVLNHNYHAIHHLWPGIPWHRYRGEFLARRESLAERGVPIETRLVGYRPRAAELAANDTPPG
jgi:fatty acid desaturase